MSDKCPDCDAPNCAAHIHGMAALALEVTVCRLRSQLRAFREPRPLSAWHDDDGDALWWRFPLNEPPYVGSPLDTEWPGYHTHWTVIPEPEIAQ